MVQRNKFCQISPTVEEVLFGIISNSHETKIKRKFNYTTLSMRKYIYSNKINSETISIHEFIDKLPLTTTWKILINQYSTEKDSSLSAYYKIVYSMSLAIIVKNIITHILSNVISPEHCTLYILFLFYSVCYQSLCIFFCLCLVYQ